MRYELQARPTTYDGIQMRSRLEAQWAANWDSRKLDWSYEPQCFATASGQYLPDFAMRVPGESRLTFIEIKGAVTDAQLQAAQQRMEIIWASIPSASLVLLVGEPGRCRSYAASAPGRWVEASAEPPPVTVKLPAERTYRALSAALVEAEQRVADLLPADTYEVEITDATAHETKAGNTYFKLELTVAVGQHEGRKLWTNVTLGQSPGSVKVFFDRMYAIGLDKEFFESLPNGCDQEALICAALLGRQAVATVKVEQFNGEPINMARIKRHTVRKLQPTLGDDDGNKMEGARRD